MFWLSRVSKNNSKTPLGSKFAVFLKPFLMKRDWRMLGIKNAQLYELIAHELWKLADEYAIVHCIFVFDYLFFKPRKPSILQSLLHFWLMLFKVSSS